MEQTLVLTRLLSPKDSYDQKILDDILLVVQNTNTLSLIDYWGHTTFNKEKSGEEFLKSIMSVSTALYKANAHRRNYLRLVDIYLEKLSNESEIKGANVDILFNEIDVLVEIDGFLSQLKTTLDALATSVNPIFNTRFDAWHKRKDNHSSKIISGQIIINTLNGLPKELIIHATPITKFIENNTEYITTVVKLRDESIHKVKIKQIQCFRYSVNEHKIIPPVIAHSSTKVEYVKEFINRTMKDFLEFVTNFIIIILSNLITDSILKADKNGKIDWYTSTKR